MPGRITRTGSGAYSCIAWIWPGLVWVRSTTPGSVVESVPHVAGRVMGRNVEQGEVVIVELHVPAAVDLESHVGPDRVNPAQDLGGGMQAPAAGGPARQGDVELFALERVFQLRRLERFLAGGKCAFQRALDFVAALAGLRPLIGRKLAQIAKEGRERRAAAEVGCFPGGECGGILHGFQRAAERPFRFDPSCSSISPR